MTDRAAPAGTTCPPSRVWRNGDAPVSEAGGLRPAGGSNPSTRTIDHERSRRWLARSTSESSGSWRCSWTTVRSHCPGRDCEASSQRCSSDPSARRTSSSRTCGAYGRTEPRGRRCIYVDWHRRLAAAGFVPANALSQMRDELEALAPGIAACLRVDASSRRAGRYPRRTLRRKADEPGTTWRLRLARRRIRALVAQRQEHRVPNPATEARHLPGALQDVGLSTNQCATVGWWAGRRQRGRRWLSCVGATPTGSIRDTVAERRGARLQSAAQRFDSARCLFLPRIERRMER